MATAVVQEQLAPGPRTGLECDRMATSRTREQVRSTRNDPKPRGVIPQPSAPMITRGPVGCGPQVIVGLTNAWRRVASSARRSTLGRPSLAPSPADTSILAMDNITMEPVALKTNHAASASGMMNMNMNPPPSLFGRWQPRWPSIVPSRAGSSAPPGVPPPPTLQVFPPDLYRAQTSHLPRLWQALASSMTGGNNKNKASLSGEPPPMLWCPYPTSTFGADHRVGCDCAGSPMSSDLELRAPSLPLPLPLPLGSVSAEAAQHLVQSLQEYHYMCVKQMVLHRLAGDREHSVDSLALSEYSTHDLVRVKVAGGAQSAFCIVDLSMIVRQACVWRYHLAQIEPHFTLTANADPAVLKALVALNVKLCCSSKADLETIRRLSQAGYSPQAIDAKPCKTPAHLAAVLGAGVRTLTVDTADEVNRIAAKAASLGIPTEALALIVRMRGAAHKGFCLGATPESLTAVLATAGRRSIAVVGLSLDVRQFASSLDASLEGQVTAALAYAQSVVALAKQQGTSLKHVGLLGLDKLAMGAMLQATIAAFFPPSSGVTFSIDATAHLVDHSTTLVTRVIGKRAAETADGNGSSGVAQGFHYYLDDGCYGSLGDVFLHRKKFLPVALPHPFPPAHGPDRTYSSALLYPSTLWGPTCDGLDCIDKMTTLPELDIGDWVYFRNVGALTFSARTNFNGLDGPTPVHVFTGVPYASHRQLQP
jgi:ornithine decarboxylase